MDRSDPARMTGRTPIALTIAGSDSGGGAGIQADLKTFAALGVYGASAITALTAQNTLGVTAVHAVPPEIVRGQIDAVLGDFRVAAIKIGMLADAEVVEAVAVALGGPLAVDENSPFSAKEGESFVVYDPVLAASSGDALAGAGFVQAVRERLCRGSTALLPICPRRRRSSARPRRRPRPR